MRRVSHTRLPVRLERGGRARRRRASRRSFFWPGFRADSANMLTYLVAIHTRMQHEMEDYKSKRGSAYLWKPHADALAYLMTAADRSLKEAEQVCVVAGQRGLGEKAKALHVTMEKVRAQISAVAQTLQT